jgi:hypothetical protein
MELWYLLLFGLMVFAIFRMWRNRDGVRIRMRDPAFDRSEGHPQAAEALSLLSNADWPALTALYWKLPPSDRYHLVQGLGDLTSDEQVSWPDEADSAILTLHGGWLIAQAWRSAQALASRAGSRSEVDRFRDSLDRARKLLTDAAIRNPHDSVNLALQIRMEMYRGGETATLNNLLGRIDATGEHNIFAAANHLQFVSPGWHGSVEQMWAAANECATNPHNAAWLAIAARAHIEEWRWSMNDPSLRRGYIARLQDEGFADHIRSLNRLFWNRAEEAEMTPAEATFAHNNMAFLLQIVRLEDLLADHLERIGPNVSALPWAYLPDGAERPTRLLMEMRRKAGLKELAAQGA